MPAASVEAEAERPSRVGDQKLTGESSKPPSPSAILDADQVRLKISPPHCREARLSYCVFTENVSTSRFPESGWLDGTVEDLADMIRLVSVSTARR